MAFPASGPWDVDLAGQFDPWRRPSFADIPHAGAVIDASWPVLTILERGSSRAEVRERLQSRAAELDRLFAEHRHDLE
jgi:predicted ATP-grasp superfamily ATP-dependent carboligase